MRLIAGFFLLLALLSSSVESQTPDPRLVVGGQQIGRWTLEMTVEQLLQTNGPSSHQPSLFADFVQGPTWYVWETLGLGVATRDRKKIQYLAITSAAYRTRQGIGPGSSGKAVQSAYGEPTVEKDVYSGRLKKAATMLAYERGGFAFFLIDGTVRLALVFRTGMLEQLLPECG